MRVVGWKARRDGLAGGISRFAGFECQPSRPSAALYHPEPKHVSPTGGRGNLTRVEQADCWCSSAAVLLSQSTTLTDGTVVSGNGGHGGVNGTNGAVGGDGGASGSAYIEPSGGTQSNGVTATSGNGGAGGIGGVNGTGGPGGGNTPGTPGTNGANVDVT